jgi:hypothetical protein
MQRQQQRFGVRFSAADIDIRRAVIYLEVSHILGPHARPDRRFARGFSCVVRVVAGAVAVVVVVVVAVVFLVAVAVVGLFVVLVFGFGFGFGFAGGLTPPPEGRSSGRPGVWRRYWLSAAEDMEGGTIRYEVGGRNATVRIETRNSRIQEADRWRSNARDIEGECTQPTMSTVREEIVTKEDQRAALRNDAVEIECEGVS